MNWNGQERRQHARAEFLCKIAIGSPARWLVSHTENISAGGIRVFLEERLKPFSPVSLELFFGNERPMQCKGKVVWVKERVNPLEMDSQPFLFEIGIRITEISDIDRDYVNRLVNILAFSKGK